VGDQRARGWRPRPAVAGAGRAARRAGAGRWPRGQRCRARPRPGARAWATRSRSRGGLAADGFYFRRTWLTVGGTLKRGNRRGGRVLRVRQSSSGHGLSSDWIPQRAEWVITRCAGNFVSRARLPARHRVCTARRSPTAATSCPRSRSGFPLAVRSSAGSPIVVRTVIGLDEQEGALVLAGEVGQGQTARLLTADLENLIEGGIQAAVCVTKTGAPASVDASPWRSRASARRKAARIVERRGDRRHARRPARPAHGGDRVLCLRPDLGRLRPARHRCTTSTLSLTVLSEGRGSVARNGAAGGAAAAADRICRPQRDVRIGAPGGGSPAGPRLAADARPGVRSLRAARRARARSTSCARAIRRR